MSGVEDDLREMEERIRDRIEEVVEPLVCAVQALASNLTHAVGSNAVQDAVRLAQQSYDRATDR